MALPGVKTTIRDRFYSLSRTDIPTGPRMAIIGRRNSTFTDGLKTFTDRSATVADADVYAATDEQRVIEIFGWGSDLHRGYLESVAGGAQRIILIPLPADTVFSHNDATMSSSSYTGDDLFDDVFAAAESIRPDVIVPYGRGSGPTEWQDPATPGDDTEIGFYADNSSVAASSWAYKVAAKCASITENTHPCFAVMGIKPYIGASTSTGSMTPAQVNGHIGSSGLANLVSTDDSTFSTVGSYLTVVATEVVPVNYPEDASVDFGFANGACTFAGTVVSYEAYRAMTMKPVFNIDKLRYDATNTQQQAIIDNGAIPVTLGFNNVPQWVDGQTMAKTGSDFKRLSTLRIVFDATLLVRRVSQKFIGEPSSIDNRNALETAVTTGLIGMQQNGALISSDFSIQYVPAQNKANIDLVLRPAFELRNIEVTVSVSFSS